jgi:hypothetical protein
MGDVGGHPGLVCFFTLPAALSCPAHLRTLLQELSAPHSVLNAFHTTVTRCCVLLSTKYYTQPSVQVEVEVTLRPTVSRPVRLGILSLFEQVTRCYIYLSDNYFLYFSCTVLYLTRGQVCNLQYNDASSISSYTATDSLSACSSLMPRPQWGP